MPDPEVLEIVRLHSYVVAMAAFSVGVLFNAVTFIATLASRHLRQSATGVYVAALVVMDTVYLVTHTMMHQFYTRWIHVDVFETRGGVALCQVWSFLKENAIYFHYLVIVVLLVDR